MGKWVLTPCCIMMLLLFVDTLLPPKPLVLTKELKSVAQSGFDDPDYVDDPK